MIEESVVSYISIHAPTRGATFWNFPQKPFRGNFNPRSHEGSDKFKVLLQSCDQISIHAPTRGATIYGPDGFVMTQISIHAPTRGATNGTEFLDQQALISIHAPTRGATQGRNSIFSQFGHFNPRSHEGSDTYNNINKNRYFISIHAPTRGATLTHSRSTHIIIISIHAPTRGATPTTI